MNQLSDIEVDFTCISPLSCNKQGCELPLIELVTRFAQCGSKVSSIVFSPPFSNGGETSRT